MMLPDFVLVFLPLLTLSNYNILFKNDLGCFPSIGVVKPHARGCIWNPYHRDLHHGTHMCKLSGTLCEIHVVSVVLLQLALLSFFFNEVLGIVSRIVCVRVPYLKIPKSFFACKF